MGASVSVSGGAMMPIDIIIGAGKHYERFSVAMVAAHSYCFGAFAGGAIDSFYQLHHNGNHLGTAISDWYVAKEKGVDDFLIKFHEWWKS